MTPTTAEHPVQAGAEVIDSDAASRLRAVFMRKESRTESEVFDALQNYSLASVSAGIQNIIRLLK